MPRIFQPKYVPIGKIVVPLDAAKIPPFNISQSNNAMNWLHNVVRFYIEGFREMTLGRTLWAIILIKLFVMFAILKLFFFRDPLAGQNDAQRSAHVMEQLTDTQTQSL